MDGMHEDHERAVSPWAGFEFLTVHKWSRSSMERASVSETEGWRFESSRDHK